MSNASEHVLCSSKGLTINHQRNLLNHQNLLQGIIKKVKKIIINREVTKN